MAAKKNYMELGKTLVRLPNYTKLLYNLLKEPEVPKLSKAYLGASVAYLTAPVDLIPGIIPVIGQLDDLLIVLSAIEKALLSCTRETAARHLNEASLTIEELEQDLLLIKSALRASGKTFVRATSRMAAGGLKLAGRAALKTVKHLLKTK